MNWAKVKNILIIIFLILNGILGYMNYQKRVAAYTLTKEQETTIKKLLYENNIMVYTLLPGKYPPMRKLLLTPKSMDGEEQTKFFKTIFEDHENIAVSTITSEQGEKQTVYSRGNEKVGFSTGHIFYRADLSSEKDIIFTKEQSKKAADAFLEKLGYTLSKLQWHFKEENGSYKFTYYETYNGELVYNSYVDFLITSKGIEKVDIYKMKPVKYTELSRSIYAPDEILFGFMNQMKKSQGFKEILVIQNIDLGYFIESEYPWRKEGEGIPYYRITLADGRNFYINAYTNQMR
ncbi:two-component system regulatory protein YycI [Defluviitalea saccharophila]|jgi:regulatory protein YycI of two-component signal transduction system YycFG|uniref:Two-component system regulatory protein YycI n=1 Tax=Defluviitalea saccharophila TaxID=879970 RepID=A0ABZ2Y1H8_9FIRM